MPIYDCGDPDCSPCRREFRQPAQRGDALKQFNDAAERAKRALERAMDVLADAQRMVEAEKARRLAGAETEGSA